LPRLQYGGTEKMQFSPFTSIKISNNYRQTNMPSANKRFCANKGVAPPSVRGKRAGVQWQGRKKKLKRDCIFTL